MPRVLFRNAAVVLPRRWEAFYCAVYAQRSCNVSDRINIGWDNNGVFCPMFCPMLVQKGDTEGKGAAKRPRNLPLSAFHLILSLGKPKPADALRSRNEHTESKKGGFALSRPAEPLASERHDAKRAQVRARGAMSAVTYSVREYPCTTSDNQEVILVDTPGLDHTELDNSEIQKRISAWLTLSSRKGVSVDAALYFHDMKADLVSYTMREDIKLLKTCCALEKVTVATTKWDQYLDQRDAWKRQDELERKFWSQLSSEGCKVPVERAGTEEEAVSVFKKALRDSIARRDTRAIHAADRDGEISRDGAQKAARSGRRRVWALVTEGFVDKLSAFFDAAFTRYQKDKDVRTPN
ncbi:hypothetical protein NMY22_g12548 [Coprinellus aureogranulatus]|nr:hypothetical protein NMY22_g12548 [Coprinellus aureogranulatus]